MRLLPKMTKGNILEGVQCLELVDWWSWVHLVYLAAGPSSKFMATTHIQLRGQQHLHQVEPGSY